MIDVAENALETAINHYLNLDPNSQEKLSALNGKVLKLCVKPITVYFCFENSALNIKSHVADELITATLEGYPLAFIQLHFSSIENAPKLFKQELSIHGDMAFGQNVRDLFQTIDIDWQEYLSHFTGDIIAHELGNLFHRSTLFANTLSTNLQQNLTEYLQEEAKHLPCKEEIEDFCDDIDHLTLRADRLQAKLKENQ
tara:strand:- start:2196 stop:2789 length:594 start_codon:yes stop_codon:yes gene_type:complete